MQRNDQSRTSSLPAGLWTAIDGIISDLDASLKHTIKSSTRTMSCHTCKTPGCCRQKTLSTGIEALRIASRHTFTPDEITRMHKVGELMESMHRDQYFERSIPCPWLVDNRCAIYEDRPVACRCYYVVTPAEHCCPESGHQVVGQLNVLPLELRTIMLLVEAQAIWLPSIEEPMLASAPRAVAICAEALAQSDPIAHLRAQSWTGLDQMIDLELPSEISQSGF